MRPGNRWLLVYAGGHLVAVPSSQVHRLTGREEAAAGCEVAPADSGAEPILPLAVRLGAAQESPDALVAWVTAGEREVGIGVREALEMIEGPELMPLPLLLRQALTNDTPVIGMIAWQSRLVVVVDLGLAVGGEW